MNAYMLLKFAAAFAFVISLMLLLAWAVRRMGLADTARGTGRRLSVEERLALDTRHRLLLVRRDKTRHLVLLGPQGALVVERNIVSPPENMVEYPVNAEQETQRDV